MYNTRYYAAIIVEQFAAFLEKERHCNDIRIYGSVHRDLVDGVEKVIVQMLVDHGIPRRDILDGSLHFNENGRIKEDKHHAGY